MKYTLLKDATSVSAYVFIQDSSVTTGAGLTGLAFNTASLTSHYVRPLGSATAITLATQTVTGAWSSGGFVEVNATTMPGVYRFDIPNAAFATGVNSVVVMLKGATNMAVCVMEIQLDDAPLTLAQVRTALGTNSSDVIAELSQAIPSATPSVAAALMLLYMQLRNATTSTATSHAVTNDAGTVIARGTLSDDGTTFTKAELVAGP